MIEPRFAEVDGIWMLRSGADFDRQAVLIPALFHEGERTRALASALMRALAERQIGSVLCELRGFGEAEGALPRAVSIWEDLVRSVAKACGARYAISVRGGALLDRVMPPYARYRLSPISGAAVVRDLTRAGAVEAAEAGRPSSATQIAAEAGLHGARLAGYALSADLFRSLAAAVPAEGEGRVARLAGDARPAQARLPGPLLWRQGEPEAADDLARALALDFDGWAAG